MGVFVKIGTDSLQRRREVTIRPQPIMVKQKDILNSSSSIAREGGKTIDAIDGMRERSASKKVRKGLASMTDAELKAKVNRLNMEKQYSDLTSADRGRGSYYLGNMLDIVGSVTAIGASAVGIAVAIRQLKK